MIIMIMIIKMIIVMIIIIKMIIMIMMILIGLAQTNIDGERQKPGSDSRNAPADMIFVTSSTSSASVKYFWVSVKLYRINMLTTL